MRFRKATRLSEISAIAVRYGFGELFGRFRSSAGNPPGDLNGRSSPARFRRMLEDLGPTFVKLGQMLSLRSDILTDAYTRELRQLQDQVRPFPEALVTEACRGQFGAPPEDLYAYFNRSPIAAGSLSQVHEARLKNGTRVAVKVQRPGIRELIEADIAIMHDAAGAVQRHRPEFALYRFPALIDDFSQSIHAELDFLHEGRNMELFRDRYAGNSDIHIPRVVWELSGNRVLTMEYADGILLSNRAAIEHADIDRRRIARNGARFVLSQIFDNGFFNADPHPGNFVLRTDGVIVPLDYGMIGFIDDRMMDVMRNSLASFMMQDVSFALDALERCDLIDERTAASGSLRRDLNDLVNYYHGLPFGRFTISRVVAQANDLIRRYRIPVPTDFALMLRALITVEGIARELDPDFDFIAALSPYARRALLSDTDPKRLAATGARMATATGALLRDAPGDLHRIIGKLRTGNLLFRIEHHGLEPVVKDIDRSVNRLAFSIVIAGLLVGSSLVISGQRQGGPAGLSVLGLCGYLVAALFSLWFIIAIIRSGRL